MADGTLAAKFEQDQAATVSAYVERVRAQDGPAGVAAAISDAVRDAKLYVFGELLELGEVQALKGDPAYNAVFELLSLFAYGTFAQSGGHTLSPPQAMKLRLLTVVSLARNSKAIPYAELQRELQITEIRELEDTVIEGIYLGLLVGKLNQKNSCLEVLSAVGRDVNAADITKMIQQLADWGGASRSVIEAIEEKTQYANEAAAAEEQHQAELTMKLEEIKKNADAIAAAMTS